MGQKQSLCGQAVDLEKNDPEQVEMIYPADWTADSSSSTGSVTSSSSSRHSSSCSSIEWTEDLLDPCQRKQLVAPCTTAEWKNSVTSLHESDV